MADNPISPELVLVDPELAAAARAALPDRPWPEPPTLLRPVARARAASVDPDEKPAATRRYDTEDGRLRGHGITLERTDASWRLELPRGEVVEARGDGYDCPREITDLLRAILDDRPLLLVPERSDDPDVVRLQEVIWEQRRAILAHDPGTRLGDDPENLHQLRVATRRLRAFLRVGRRLVDPDWAEGTRRQLGELGSSLGPVRDLDVLLENLRREVSSLDEAEQQGAKELLARLELGRDQLQEKLVQALDAPAYAALVERLHRPLSPAAEPPKRSLMKLAQREVKRLAKRVDQLGDAPADEALHRLRVRVKRVRYALELAAPDDERTERMIRAAKRLQDVLGEHQDAVVAEQQMRSLAAEVDSAPAFVAGRLAEQESQRRRQLREQFPRAWRRLRRASRKLD